MKRMAFFCFAVLVLLMGSARAQSLAEESLKKGLACIQDGNYDEAVTELSSVIESDSKNAVAYYNRGLAYNKSQKPAKAILDYTKAIELDPKNAEIYYNRGIVYYYQDELDKAIADWTQVIEIDSEYAQAYQKRAFGYFKKHEYDKAWDDVRAVKKLGYGVDPNFLESLKSASGKRE